MVSSTRGRVRIAFANRDFNAAINIGRCAVLDKRPPELIRADFVGEPLRVELYGMTLQPVVGGRSKKSGRHLRWDAYIHYTVVGLF